MKLHNDSLQMVKFYEKLGFSKEQSIVLWEFHYNDSELESAINVYNQSSLKLKWISFCKSVADFIEFIEYWEDEEVSHNFWWLYKFKLSLWSKNDWITKSELIKKFASECPAVSVDDIRPNTRISWNQYSKSYISFGGVCRSVECKACCDKVVVDDEYEDEGDDIENGDEIAFSNSEMVQIQWYFSKAFNNDRKVDNILEKTRYDKYQQIDEKWFMKVLSNPTSTIRTNCNTASMDIIRENIRQWYSVDISMVRAEELLNYFNYDLNEPEKNKKFWVTVKLWDKPNSDNKMMLVWIQWEKVLPSRQNIVALLDVSWSMGRREVQMQGTIMTLISKLNDGDKFSLITYSSNDETIIDDVTFKKDIVDDLIEKVLSINIYWCTNWSWALNQAYDLIANNKIEDWVNRVVIMTDWDFNFWDCSIDKVKKLILEKKETWAYLSVVWTWTYNTNDELMETLAKNWNWNYCVVNNLWDVEENIYNKYNKLMFTIATDVKAQIEFNPKFIKSYRLIWYENRTLSHNEFRDDTVIAEPFGCWNYCMALYEVEMSDNKSVDSDLKYQKSEVLDSDDLCTLHIRYKNLWEEESAEETTSVLYKDVLVENDADIDMAYVIYIVAERLRDSEYLNTEDISEAKRILKKLEWDKEYTINDDKIGVVKELIW